MDGSGGHITTAIAIDKDKNSQFAVKWALENLLKRMPSVAIIHVLTQTTLPDGAGIGKDGRPPTGAEMQQFFTPVRAFCARKGVKTKEIVLQGSDVSTALIEFINRNTIVHLVVGASARTALTRAFRSTFDVPTSLQKSLPDYCNLYVVSKTKSQKIKSAICTPLPNTTVGSTKPTKSSLEEMDLGSQPSNTSGTTGSGTASYKRSNASVDFSDLMPMAPRENLLGITSPSPQEFTAGINNQLCCQTTERVSPDSRPRSTDVALSNVNTNLSDEILDKPCTSDVSGLSISSENPELEDEMRRLKLELKQTMDMYHAVCKEATNAKQKANEIDRWKSTDALKYEEVKAAEATLMAVIEMEKQKSKAAMKAAQIAQRLAELEAQKRRIAESKAKHEAAERKKAMEASPQYEIQYRKYTIEEIEIATDHFSNSLKVGEGGYGPVFKACLDHIDVAIKVLRPDISHGQSQFQKEVEILGWMRHPHMVLLLGACPEYGCLVYEYMENGSLEDRLFRKKNTPPLPRSLRFKICAEIGTALLFLHQTRPKPLVHRDLKPANILLDGNYVSKISDVGLARLVPPSVANSVTEYHMTAAAGTFCYIDPEYQQTGMLGTKSDIYSFGVILLQVLTGKSPMGITHQVENAIENDTFQQVLDPTVTDWPVEDTLSLAKLALQCCELRRKDRPDLGSVILPELKRLRDLGDASNKV